MTNKVKSVVITFGDEDKIIWWKNSDGMSMSLPDFPAIDITDSSNAGLRWKKWMERFDACYEHKNSKTEDIAVALGLYGWRML